MIIRKIKKEERFESFLISSYCFHRRSDDIEKERERVEGETAETWGAFTEDGKMAARITNNRFTFTIDSAPVAAGGIGGVATLPEYRNTGAIREIFRELLPAAYEAGEVISTLYPFNHAFYRKQGYDTVAYRNTYTLDPAFLEPYKTDCKATLWHPGDSVGEYLKVYNEFIKSFNLAMPRDEEIMKKHIAVDSLFKERQFSYLFTKDGKSLAYVIFEDVKSEPEALLRVEETAWVNRDGFEAVLAFLGRFDADYGKINLPLPYGIDLLRIIRTRRAYDIEKSTEISYMVRVINAEKLLTVLKKPADCDFTLKLTDDIIRQNNATFRVTSDGVERVAGEVCPDLEIAHPSFAQLATGCIGLDEAILKPDVQVNGKEEMLRRVFTEKKIFINEHF